MSQDFTAPETSAIEIVRRKFEAWRETKELHEPIPTELWKAAAKLCGTHRPYIIARKLGLNYNKLKEHVDTAQASPTEARFVELGFTTANTVCEYVIEMQDPNGGKMRLQSKGHQSPNPIEICKLFWGKGS